jgi:hypothetical protein
LLRLMTDPTALADGRHRAQQDLACYRVGRMAREYIAVYEAAIRSRKTGARSAPPLGAASAPGE